MSQFFPSKYLVVSLGSSSRMVCAPTKIACSSDLHLCTNFLDLIPEIQ